MTDHDSPDELLAADAAADARLRVLLRGARDHYNVPPRSPDFDAMWSRVERDAFGGADVAPAAVVPIHTKRSWRAGVGRYGAWVGLAAGLLIGVAVGRGIRPTAAGLQEPTVATASDAATPDPAAGSTVDLATARYLGQTAALLVSLPAEQPGAVAEPQFVDRARQLLSTTRLLLDAPAASDPQTRALLEDLELVLAQIVGIPSGNRREELELINQALEQRELLPRLQSAVSSAAPVPAAGDDD